MRLLGNPSLMRNTVVGSNSAETLFSIGLPHDAVVRALVEELDLTTDEAELAWRAVAERGAELISIRQSLRNIDARRRVA